MPSSTGGGPMDWGYTTDAADWGQTLGISHFWRMYRGRVIATQSRNNTYGQATTRYNYNFNDGPGFSITNANFWEVFGRIRHAGDHGRNRLAGDIALTRRAMGGYWNEWFSFTRTVPTELWARDPEPSAWVEPPDATPTPWTPGVGDLYFDTFTDANNTYRLPALMVQWGMDSAAVDNVARWGESMWPNGNFEQWFATTTTGEPPGPEGALLSAGQATPNPFRTSVTIPYEVSASAHVNIEVFDALGRRVATLVNEEQSAGTYSPTMNSAGLSNGLYLVRIRAGDESVSRTMVLER
jgi:hypothetical protein